MNNLKEIERMTTYEFQIRSEAHRLKTVDKEYFIHLQAWANRDIKRERSTGKNKSEPFYKSFKSFYDYEKELGINESKTRKKEDKKLNNMILKANK